MTLHHGDCLDVMAAMEPESVDAIVTDPPYGLEFMGKEWDRPWAVGAAQGVGYAGRDDLRLPAHRDSRNANCRACGGRMRGARKCSCPEPQWDRHPRQDMVEYGDWSRRWAEAALRVAKPSAYLLAFGGTRTVHRMTVALEDAGWIIRDMLVWAYASGFPKSKASLKPAWEPIVLARKPGPLRELAIDACRIPIDPRDPVLSSLYVHPGINNSAAYGAENRPAGRSPMAAEGGRWPANVILTDPIFDGGWDGVVGGGEAAGSKPFDWTSAATRASFPVGREASVFYDDSGTYSRFFVLPKADRADREPVLDEYAYRLHRERGECGKLSEWAGADLSPSEQTGSTSPGRDTSEGTSTDDSSSGTSSLGKLSTVPSPPDTRSTTSTGTSRTTGSATSSSSTPSPTSGSTPAASSETESGGSPATSAGKSSLWAPSTGTSPERDGPSTVDAVRATSGSSSSRSVCGRCGKRLPRFSTHPTQKPTELMRHLVRLVTPTDGVVLDPFLGSGTTALAAEMEGFAWVGIEREAEYVAIAEARLNGTQRGLGLAS